MTNAKLIIAALAALVYYAAVLTGCNRDENGKRYHCRVIDQICHQCADTDRIVNAIKELTEAVKANQQKGATQ